MPPSAPHFDHAETETAARRKAGFTTVFDSLIQSNLALSSSVGRLVKLSWAIVALNLALIVVVIVTLAWATLVRVPARSRSLLDVGGQTEDARTSLDASRR